MQSSKRLRKQMAKVEYTVCKETVDSMLAQNFSPKLIHEKLTAEGRFTMAYTSFTQILRNAERNPPPAKTAVVETKQAVPVRPQRQPGIIKAESKTFPDPRAMNPNDSF